MSAAHEKSDAAVEEKQVALSYDDVLSQAGHVEGVGRDYELKCNLSKQGASPFM